MVALAIAALAESSALTELIPLNRSFDPLKGIRSHRGKALAAFLKAVGNLLAYGYRTSRLLWQRIDSYSCARICCT